MPHVIVKMYAGRPASEKKALAEAITRAVMKTLGYVADSVSVGIEDVTPSDWAEHVYKPDIIGKSETLFKTPGYTPAGRHPIIAGLCVYR
jgi:4-oxalocrotonate tautomerase